MKLLESLKAAAKKKHEADKKARQEQKAYESILAKKVLQAKRKATEKETIKIAKQEAKAAVRNRKSGGGGFLANIASNVQAQQNQPWFGVPEKEKKKKNGQRYDILGNPIR